MDKEKEKYIERCREFLKRKYTPKGCFRVCLDDCEIFLSKDSPTGFKVTLGFPDRIYGYLQPGKSIKLKGDQHFYFQALKKVDKGPKWKIKYEGKDGWGYVEGNIMHLLGDPDGDTVAPHAFEGLFEGWNLNAADGLKLPAKNLGEYCYAKMFKGCKRMVWCTPVLPAEKLARGCYSEMFAGCENLSLTKILAKEFAPDCFDKMFAGNVCELHGCGPAECICHPEVDKNQLLKHFPMKWAIRKTSKLNDKYNLDPEKDIWY